MVGGADEASTSARVAGCRYCHGLRSRCLGSLCFVDGRLRSRLRSRWLRRCRFFGCWVSLTALAKDLAFDRGDVVQAHVDAITTGYAPHATILPSHRPRSRSSPANRRGASRPPLTEPTPRRAPVFPGRAGHDPKPSRPCLRRPSGFFPPREYSPTFTLAFVSMEICRVSGSFLTSHLLRPARSIGRWLLSAHNDC